MTDKSNNAFAPSVRVPQRPAMAVPPRPRLQLWGSRLALMPSMWAWPLVLSLLLVGGVMVWLRAKEVADLESQRADMISDALSLEAQITSRLDDETGKLRALANEIESHTMTQDAFSRHALVLDGLRRFWVSLTWLGDDGRIMAHLPDDTLPARDALRNSSDEGGMAGHLSVSLPGRADHPGGMLVARYSAAALLRQKVPWWLASKYDIRLVDESDEVIAATVDGPRRAVQAWYRVSMAPTLPNAWLELSSRERITPWWRTMPMALMGGFVLLLGVASFMLRRQMQSVSRAEEAWRTEAAWRSAMEDSLAVGIRARDLQGRLVYVNKTMADMVGYQPDELIGLMPPMPYWVPHELDQSMRRHLRNMAGKAPREGYESRWQHRDGRLVEVMVFEAPLVDAKGVQIGWMASVLNVTERKRMEERERKQLETMAHHARLTMLGEVASTLAHELNQPLTAIASYNAGLLNALGPRDDLDPQVMKALQTMGEQARHAGRIVMRIREFLTRREPQREPCRIMDVIESGAGLLKRDLSRHQVRLDIHGDDTLPAVWADPVLIEQVVVNLVRNACDALAAGPAPRHIQVSATQSGGFVRVSVTDNGPGLHGQDSERLFAPFYSTKSEGMGMGLAICRSIIELHYGALDASDAPEGGATFSFSLPIHHEDEPGKDAGESS
ncbi:MAG TPA: ATP-binding protein [Aquabacterium sp.]|uniref:sensor histidine kinase n=1 Tax=Aquabacterium sp. TaxID=1872578 RepID=UPI002E310509|nr:ATP-binding protein [Aquabacterium sp.]HEX5357855.1 ATP-binding protein [Aquabacterium sp.]